MRELRKPALYSFAALAAIGLALSVISHVAALFGSPLGGPIVLLHLGIFAVWLPAIVASRRLTKGFPRKDYWKRGLRGCPAWMRYMVYSLLGYALLNFAIFIVMPLPKGESGPLPPSGVRIASGLWMAFYAAGAAFLYSTATIKE
jgi:putative copper export protein